MTDQKLLQEAIAAKSWGEKVSFWEKYRITAEDVQFEAARAHLASLTPVSDQARAEALDENAAGELANIPSHHDDPESIRQWFVCGGRNLALRAVFQTPPVTADASEVEKMQVPEWLPIETAPKDGTEILALRKAPHDDVILHVRYWPEWHGPNKGAWHEILMDDDITDLEWWSPAPKHAETIAMEGE